MNRKNKLMILFALAMAVSLSSQTVAEELPRNWCRHWWVPDRGGGVSLSPSGNLTYMNLYDHPGPSGVPLGGIGTGYLSIAPDGNINRVAINNTFTRHVIRNIKGSFFAVSEGNKAFRLVRDTKEYGAMPGYEHSLYRGLYPFVGVSFGAMERHPVKKPQTRVALKAFSPIIPHNIKDSSLPVVFFEVHLHSSTNPAKNVAVAFSWEDILGRHILDVKDDNVFKRVRNNTFWSLNEHVFGYRDRIPTYVNSWENKKLKGVEISIKEDIKPRKDTFQNYTNRLLVLAEKQPGAEISLLGGYDVGKPGEAWESFRGAGKLPETKFGRKALYQPKQKKEKAVAVCVRTRLKGAEKRVVRFMLVWNIPKLETNRPGRHPFATFPSTDYNRYFHNFFDGIKDITEYCYNNRQRLQRQTRAWQEPILRSTYPDWLKFKIINSGYVLTTNSILNQNGDFTIVEAGLWGFTGTVCQKLVSHPFLMKLFPKLERAENESAARAQQKNGSIPTFLGGLYHGIVNRKTGANSSPGPDHLDSTGVWLILTAEDFLLTNDKAYLVKNRQVVKKCFGFLKSRIWGAIQIPTGGASIDDFPAPAICSYQASVYLAALNAVRVIAKALDEDQLYKQAEEQFKRTSRDFVKHLWNGKFFSYGCDLSGGNERDRLMFTGQLTGQFINGYLHWPDIVPFEMVKASAEAQLRTSVAYSPEHYAPKLFDLDSFSGVDRLTTRCWPFYLEAGTAMLAFQAGYVRDCHRIMQSLQDVQAKRGYSWSQNLWIPGEMAYMSAPVSWFATDLMVSGGLDVGSKTLFIAPVLEKRYPKSRMPMYFPGFWAEVYCDQGSKRITLTILECFDPDIEISRVGVHKPSQASSKIRFIDVKPMRVKKGLKCDLSAHWDKLVYYTPRGSVLSAPGKVIPKTIKNPYGK